MSIYSGEADASRRAKLESYAFEVHYPSDREVTLLLRSNASVASLLTIKVRSTAAAAACHCALLHAAAAVCGCCCCCCRRRIRRAGSGRRIDGACCGVARLQRPSEGTQLPAADRACPSLLFPCAPLLCLLFSDFSFRPSTPPFPSPPLPLPVPLRRTTPSRPSAPSSACARRSDRCRRCVAGCLTHALGVRCG